jgi:alpha-tubulin suppressor-like RCC1 family protein
LQDSDAAEHPILDQLMNESDEEDGSLASKSNKRLSLGASAAAIASQTTTETTTALLHAQQVARNGKHSKAQVIADLPAFIKSKVRQLLVWPVFDKLVLVVIFASCVILALDAPDVDPSFNAR